MVTSPRAAHSAPRREKGVEPLAGHGAGRVSHRGVEDAAPAVVEHPRHGLVVIGASRPARLENVGRQDPHARLHGQAVVQLVGRLEKLLRQSAGDGCSRSRMSTGNGWKLRGPRRRATLHRSAPRTPSSRGTRCWRRGSPPRLSRAGPPRENAADLRLASTSVPRSIEVGTSTS